ncbi:MAG: hypothetical protein Fues2KO_54390 [Fuerstiella sp.]
MSETGTCPQCGRQIPHDAPEDVCPACVLASGLLSSTTTLLGSSEPAPDRPDSPATAELTPPAAAAFGPQSFAIPAPQTLAPLFPGLEIQSLLGQGGMGAVYQARQVRLDRLVALKVIRPESADDPAFAERFHREARTLARMNHPNIVGVHDFGEVECEGATLYYFVMEFVDGMNLRQWMQAGRVSVEQAATILAQVCDALQYAHDEGVVHRDIKPENLLLDRRGRVKIADFGLARLVVRSAEDFALTGTHQVMGTPRYMAPEQLAGSRDVDHRADIYALGVVFYEMLTGSLPLGSFDPPSARVGCDSRLDQIVLTALASDPDRRFDQVRQLGEQLQTVVPAAVTSISVFADANALPGQPWPGPSTILENAAGAAWGQVQDGRLLRLLAHRNAPAIVAGCAGVIQILTSVVAVVVSYSLKQRNGTEWATALSSMEPPMMSAAANAFALLLILIGFSTSRKFDRWRPAIVLSSGIVAAFCVIIAWDSVGTPRRFHSDDGLNTAVLCFLGLVAVTIVTLMAGACDLRNWLNGRPPRPAAQAQSGPWRASSSIINSGPALPVQVERSSLSVQSPQQGGPVAPQSPVPETRSESLDIELEDIAAQAEIDGPATSLILVGVLSLVGHVTWIIYAMQDRSFDNDVLIFWSFGGLVAASLMIFGGFHFRKRTSLAWSRIGSIAACLPIGPAFWITVIAGVYAKRTLDRESIRQAFFRETRRLRRQRRNEPRLSGKAAFGTIWALSSLLFQLLLIVSVFAIRKNQTGAFASPFSDITVIQLIPLGLVALAPALSTVFGVLAIRDIKRSRGMLKGFGLAFFSVVCFPVLMFNAIILSRLMPAVDYLLSDLSPPLTRAISTILGLGMIMLNILLLWCVWRKLKPHAELTAVSQESAASNR